jgi:hypothetical protein
MMIVAIWRSGTMTIDNAVRDLWSLILKTRVALADYMA